MICLIITQNTIKRYTFNKQVITIENVQNKKIVFYFWCENRYDIDKILL